MQRREELDGLVRPEEPLVAVEANEKLGRDVPEEPEHPRAVDEAAAVVRVVRGESDAKHDLQSNATHALVPSMMASCVPCAVGWGGGGRPCRSSSR